jgi:AcrR family transcriptional regulator
MDAAYELLVEQGYQAATVQSIARRANLTTGAIYANFANKHELLVLAALERWFATGFGSSPEDLSTDDGITDLLVRHLSAEPTPEHRLLTEVTGAALRDPAGQDLLRRGAEQVAAMTRYTLDEAKASGAVRQDMPTEAWVALTVNQFLGAITSKSFDLPQPGAGEVRALIDSFLASWRPTPPDAG